MGNLRDQIFFRAINDSLDRLRNEMCLKYKPKKENRFLVSGITYEIGTAKLFGNGVQFEISSKIPQEVVPKKGMNAKYFKEVRDLMMKGSKKPMDVRMENIISSTNIQEIKERDYVKGIYFFANEELWTEADIAGIVRAVNSGKLDLSDIPGITTIAGKAVIYKMQESIYAFASKLINEFLKANDSVHRKYTEIARTMANAPSPSAPKAPSQKAVAKKSPAKKKAAPKKPSAKKKAKKK